MDEDGNVLVGIFWATVFSIPLWILIALATRAVWGLL